MFGFGVTELLVIGVVLAVALFLSSSKLPTWTNVDQRWHAAGQGIDLERALLRTLSTSAIGSILAPGVGRIVITQRRTPLWTVVLAVCTFPLGLLFLLFKVEHILNVMITPDERGGSRIDLVGVTRASTLEALTDALVTEHGADSEPVSSRL